MAGIAFTAIQAGFSACWKRFCRSSAEENDEEGTDGLPLCEMRRTPKAASAGEENELPFYDSLERRKISKHRNRTPHILSHRKQEPLGRTTDEIHAGELDDDPDVEDWRSSRETPPRFRIPTPMLRNNTRDVTFPAELRKNSRIPLRSPVIRTEPCKVSQDNQQTLRALEDEDLVMPEQRLVQTLSASRIWFA